jgi:adenylate kinase
MRIIFLGAPGSGKGTQARLLSGRLGVPAISTGEMLRAAVREGTALGRQAQEIMDRGELVPDAVMIGLIRERVASPDARDGFLLDGFPRTVEQARSLDGLLAGNAGGLSAVVNLLVPEPLLEDRLLHRATAEGRSDDRPEAIRERLRVYRERTEPLIAFYRQRGLLAEVDGVGPVSEISGRIDRALEARRGAGSA